jgi:hypothetical protein
MKRWQKNSLVIGGTILGGILYNLGVKAQTSNPPASYWGKAYDRGVEVDDSTLVRVYDTNGTGDGLAQTDDDQLIGEGIALTYNSEKGWFSVNALTDDPSTTTIDEGGSEDGNTYFKLVRKSDGKEHLAYIDENMTTHIIKHKPGVSQNFNAYTDFSVGIEPIDDELGLKVYPVPFDDKLFIEDPFSIGEKNFEVFNLAGQKVLEGRYEAGERVTLDVGGMASGAYIMRITSGDNTIERKIDVKKIIKK